MKQNHQKSMDFQDQAFSELKIRSNWLFRRKTSKVESPENKSFKLKLIPTEAAAAEKKINKTKLTTWIWSGCQKFLSNRSIKFWRAEVRLRPTFEASPLCLSLFFVVVEALKNWWDTLLIFR